METQGQLGIGLQVSDVSGQKLHNVSNVPPIPIAMSSQCAPTEFPNRDADWRFAVGTSVPGFAFGGAAPFCVPVIGLTQRMFDLRRMPPFRPFVFCQSSRMSRGLAGVPKLIHDNMHPASSGAVHAGSPSAGRSLAVSIGHPTT